MLEQLAGMYRKCHETCARLQAENAALLRRAAALEVLAGAAAEIILSLTVATSGTCNPVVAAAAAAAAAASAAREAAAAPAAPPASEAAAPRLSPGAASDAANAAVTAAADEALCAAGAGGGRRDEPRDPQAAAAAPAQGEAGADQMDVDVDGSGSGSGGKREAGNLSEQEVRAATGSDGAPAACPDMEMEQQRQALRRGPGGDLLQQQPDARQLSAAAQQQQQQQLDPAPLLLLRLPHVARLSASIRCLLDSTGGSSVLAAVPWAKPPEGAFRALDLILDTANISTALLLTRDAALDSYTAFVMEALLLQTLLDRDFQMEGLGDQVEAIVNSSIGWIFAGWVWNPSAVRGLSICNLLTRDEGSPPPPSHWVECVRALRPTAAQLMHIGEVRRAVRGQQCCLAAAWRRLSRQVDAAVSRGGGYGDILRPLDELRGVLRRWEVVSAVQAVSWIDAVTPQQMARLCVRSFPFAPFEDAVLEHIMIASDAASAAEARAARQAAEAAGAVAAEAAGAVAAEAAGAAAAAAAAAASGGAAGR